MSYSNIVMDHFRNPRRVGELEDSHGRARLENPVCGDVTEFFVRLGPGSKVVQVRFRVLGCVAAIAAASCLGDLVEGRSFAEAESVDVESLLKALGGLPASKKHGATLAVEAFRQALKAAWEGTF